MAHAILRDATARDRQRSEPLTTTETAYQANQKTGMTVSPATPVETVALDPAVSQPVCNGNVAMFR